MEGGDKNQTESPCSQIFKFSNLETLKILVAEKKSDKLTQVFPIICILYVADL